MPPSGSIPPAPLRHGPAPGCPATVTPGPATPCDADHGDRPTLPDQQQGRLARALGRIQARTSVIASRHDLYFTPEDCAREAALIPGAHFLLLDSDLGHRAGNPRDDPDLQARIRAELEALCAG
jgi:hypothetical protein